MRISRPVVRKQKRRVWWSRLSAFVALSAVLEVLTGVAIASPATAATCRQVAYVANLRDGTVSVIDTHTNAVTTINGFNYPVGVAVAPDGNRVYVANRTKGTVSVIDTDTNAVTTIDGFHHPLGVAIARIAELAGPGAKPDAA